MGNTQLGVPQFFWPVGFRGPAGKIRLTQVSFVGAHGRAP